MPGETRESIRKTIDFAKKLDNETIQVSIAHPYPGTEFYDYAKKNNLISIGNIVDELRATGRLDNTMIMFMSDNGIQMGEHRWIYKLVPYEESIRVPLVVRYPPTTSANAGKVSKSIVANVDLAPTFADIAGIPFNGVGTVAGVEAAR